MCVSARFEGLLQRVCVRVSCPRACPSPPTPAYSKVYYSVCASVSSPRAHPATVHRFLPRLAPHLPPVLRENPRKEVAMSLDAYNPATSSHVCKLPRVHWCITHPLFPRLPVHAHAKTKTAQGPLNTLVFLLEQEHAMQALPGFYPLPKAIHVQSGVEGV